MLQAFMKQLERCRATSNHDTWWTNSVFIDKVCKCGKSFWDWEVPHGCSLLVIGHDKKAVLEGKAMHVIFGGAFNGKRAYVEQRVQGRNVQWLDAEADALVLLPNTEVIVVLGVENLLEPKSKELLEKLEAWDEQAEVVSHCNRNWPWNRTDGS